MENTLTLSQAFKDTFKIKTILRSFKGGQKTVFIAEVESGSIFAFKIFHSFNEREKREVSLYQKYQDHNGIPRLIDVVDYSGETVLIEEYIEGRPLTEILQEGFYLGNKDNVATLIKNIVLILEVPWKDGVVHRDIKPDNIIIRPDGSAVIIDFGIARDLNADTITETGFQPNSWRFAAPEQIFAKKDQISYRTDFFSIGAMAYFLYHGKLPFGETFEETHMNLSNASSSPDFPEVCGLKTFCNDACKINPSERPRNVDLFTASLK